MDVTELDVAELNDSQLNRYIADRRAVHRRAKAQMEEGLAEWKSRHGGLAGTRVELAGVTILLEPNARWNEEVARSVLADRPDLVAQIETTVLDRARAKDLLDEETYARCQKPTDAPTTRVILGKGALPSVGPDGA